jgi:hypothetical protein
VVTHKKKKTRSLAFTIVSTNLKNRFDNRWGSVAVSNNRPTLIGVLFSLTCAIVSEWPQRLRRRRSWKHHLIDISWSTWLLQLSQKVATTCSQSQQTVHCVVNTIVSSHYYLAFSSWHFVGHGYPENKCGLGLPTWNYQLLSLCLQLAFAFAKFQWSC